MLTIREKLFKAKELINQKSLEENVGFLIMEEVQNFKSRTELLLNLDKEMTNEELFDSYLMEYLLGKPIQYVLKKAWFLNNIFYVDNRVLIPRMETEEVVQAVLGVAKNMKSPLIYDVCTGSGCIALTLGLSLKDAKIIGSDISLDALDVANINRTALNVENVKFIHSDMFIKYPYVQADIIVSNPPYVDKKEKLEHMVLHYEPNNALFPPSGNGLEFYQRFFIVLPSYLKDGGYFIAEFGTNQKEGIEKMALSLLPNSKIEFYKDISNKYRYFILQYFV